MKKLFPIILIVIALSLTGCLEFTEMTEEEADKVAQGTAWIILQHNRYYAEKLATPTPSPSPTPTPTWFPSATPTPTPKAEVTGTDKPNPTKAPDKDENQTALAELKDVIGIDEISLEYGGYDFCSNYTFDSYSIEAENPDNQLMIMKIMVKNNSKSEVNINLAKLFLEYRLDVDTKRSIKPLMTILFNDFTTLSTKIKAGESYEAVLAFEVEKNFTAETLNLFITKGNKTVIIKLK